MENDDGLVTNIKRASNNFSNEVCIMGGAKGMRLPTPTEVYV